MLSAALDNLSQLAVKGVGKANMADNTTLKEGKGADALGAVNDLVGDDKIHRLDLLLQRADGSEGDDASDTDGPQSCNVGAVWDLVGSELVVNAMTGEEGNVGAVVGEDVDGRGGRPPGGDGVQGCDGLEAIELAETRTANYGNRDRFYVCVSTRFICKQPWHNVMVCDEVRPYDQRCWVAQPFLFAELLVMINNVVCCKL